MFNRNILAISGSTREQSVNGNMIKAVTALSTGRLDIKQFKGLSDLPHFNPDLDNENPPSAVIDFRNQLKEADGVLICTPEYAMGVPGSLKNALDWIVSSCELSKKPVALITASTSGKKAHESLLGTLKVIEAEVKEEAQLVVSFAKSKLNGDQITDKDTLLAIQKLIDVFVAQIDLKKEVIA